jgi:hypothetical protein
MQITRRNLGARGRSPYRRSPSKGAPAPPVVRTNLSITGLAANVFSVLFTDRTPVNQLSNLPFVEELFVASGANLPQLTSFNRSDTGFYGFLLSPDRRRVLFQASADPFGMNPYENCQIFCIDTLGADLRDEKEGVE